MLKELNNAMEYIEVHLEDEFLLEKISEHINVSDYHFRKIRRNQRHRKGD